MFLVLCFYFEFVRGFPFAFPCLIAAWRLSFVAANGALSHPVEAERRGAYWRRPPDNLFIDFKQVPQQSFIRVLFRGADFYHHHHHCHRAACLRSLTFSGRCLDHTAKLCTRSVESSINRDWLSMPGRWSRWCNLCLEAGGKERKMESEDGFLQVMSRCWR